MAVNTIAGSYDGMAGWDGSSGAYNWNNYNKGYKVVGARYPQYNYWPLIVKFTTPAFSGKSISIAFSLNAAKYGPTNYAYGRWNLCTSDSYQNLYKRTVGAVSDPTAIASGTWGFTGLVGSYATKSVGTATIATLSPNTTYYLYVWTNEYYYFYVNNMSYILTCESGGIRIGNQEGVVYVCIDGVMKEGTPYVYSGGAWKPPG